MIVLYAREGSTTGCLQQHRRAASGADGRWQMADAGVVTDLLKKLACGDENLFSEQMMPGKTMPEKNKVVDGSWFVSDRQCH